MKEKNVDAILDSLAEVIIELRTQITILKYENECLKKAQNKEEKKNA